MKESPVVIITGPTGVGKTTFVDHLATVMPIEVINADVGQFYVPLSIGTAKPKLLHAGVPHHMFDIIEGPRNFSVTNYRNTVKKCITEIRARKHIPVVVGGSLFYINSLFFPPLQSPQTQEVKNVHPDDIEQLSLWDQLYAIDPQRAHAIHRHDEYRLKRAIDLWRLTGMSPSQLQPTFDPIDDTIFLLWIERDREELYKRINDRVISMIEEGWLSETEQLIHSEWESFIRTKGIIGYDLLFDVIKGIVSYQDAIARIQQATRHYAKRQWSYWRRLKKQLQSISAKKYQKTLIVDELNLTHTAVESYIRHLKITIEHGSENNGQ